MHIKVYVQTQKRGMEVYNFSGKGLTKEQCKISAIMEGIERYCAEERNNRDIILKKSIAELRTNYNIVEPKELNILNQSISENDEIEWI